LLSRYLLLRMYPVALGYKMACPVQNCPRGRDRLPRKNVAKIKPLP